MDHTGRIQRPRYRPHLWFLEVLIAGITWTPWLAFAESNSPQEQPATSTPEKNNSPIKLQVTGSVIDADGKPVAGASVRLAGEHPSPPGSLLERFARSVQGRETFTDAQGRFTLTMSVDRSRAQTLVATHAERKLVGTATLPTIGPGKDQPKSIRITLQPMAVLVGRVLDPNKQPIKAAQAQLFQVTEVDGGWHSQVVETTSTDSQGKYRFELPTLGGRYYVQATAPSFAGTQTRQHEAQPGKTITAPDLTLAVANEEIAGVAVDPTGKPIGGVTVYAWPQTPNVVITRPTHAQTLKDGRFRISGLPKGPVQINAFRQAVFAPGATNRPTMARVQAGQRDIKLVFFSGAKPVPPSVGKPAPDLVGVRDSLAQNDFRDRVSILVFVDEAKPSQRLLLRLETILPRSANRRVTAFAVYEATPGAVLKSNQVTPLPVTPGLVPGGYSPAFQNYGVDATPTIFLVDPHGIIRGVDVDPNDLEAQLAKLTGG
jgi:protocatechuate 3,4-dioxygenase beta subunit